MTEPAIDADTAERLADAGWVVLPGFMREAQWHRLARDALRFWRHGAFRHAGVGRGASFSIRPSIRNDQVCWLDPATATVAQRAYFACIEALRLALNQTLYLGLFGFEAHLAVYPPGAFYRRHLDRFRDAPHRRVSCVFYLNDDWQPTDGGALRLYPPGQPPQDILPQGGALVLFMSAAMEHEVLPARRERLSITGWLGQRPP